MKAKLIIAALALMAGMAHGAVTLQFSTTSVYLSNFANGSGSSDGAAARMVWGIVVDAGGNGFSTDPYKAGFNLSANASGIALTTTTDGLNSFATDDVLFIAGSVMGQNSNANDSSAIGMNRILSFANMNYGFGGVGTGDAFKIIWFDALALSGAQTTTGLKYGLHQLSALNLLPADPGTYDLSAPSLGADSLKTMDFALNVPVPEPSSALLGLLGVVGLIRRRR